MLLVFFDKVSEVVEVIHFSLSCEGAKRFIQSLYTLIFFYAASYINIYACLFHILDTLRELPVSDDIYERSFIVPR